MRGILRDRIWPPAGGGDQSRPTEIAAETPFEDVADAVFRLQSRHWKLGTLEVNRRYLKNQILPRFRGQPIGAITGADAQQWFASLRSTPAAADRAAPVLSVIMREAETLGFRPENTNPCGNIRRYRRRGRERFLSREEFWRLGVVLQTRRHQHSDCDFATTLRAGHP